LRSLDVLITPDSRLNPEVCETLTALTCKVLFVDGTPETLSLLENLFTDVANIFPHIVELKLHLVFSTHDYKGAKLAEHLVKRLFPSARFTCELPGVYVSYICSAEEGKAGVVTSSRFWAAVREELTTSYYQPVVGSDGKQVLMLSLLYRNAGVATDMVKRLAALGYSAAIEWPDGFSVIT
jgi:hypothetical protein